ncbi:chromosome segregation protein SMC [Acinetobacter qingfengensis]|uniref:Chromosome partition protein Smc n=1 Tax=Acinetobacter qingfengensis TaxID=1262585 RepID=A0A1E7RCQ1_9GAMM|nr:chromosome segregation protein SMC [Acinetobacter qingfengensis]KAA8734348.1 chromosome segregation protein SMC [Acinetobacter qingfengensis]OEY97111.1 chromosome segregation protein SMC [Acinetobacter qingfengensis]
MRLSRLKLAGFKSFADTATLNFKDNRTAIVGPNGCGKSNVIDAIRWVMGESSAKQLRGGNMQDVIFAGTSHRKPIGLASVELHFDNTYGKLGGEYNAYTELSVKRQVTREGKSDYFLNGTKCRRRDITDIFLGTGLGPRSYAVIEQGMINRLVDAKPDEMRVFIEEAAGISRYQARRRETLQHLEHTQNNLFRLNDIALELHSQIKTLKRQAEQAEKYQSLQKQIVQYKIQLLSAQYHQEFDQVEQLTQSLKNLTDQFQQHHQQLEQIEIESHLLQQNIQQQLPQAEQLQQSWQQAQQQHQHVLWQLEQDQQQQQQLQHSLMGLEQQHQQLQDEHQQLNTEIEQLQHLQGSYQQQYKVLQQTTEDNQIELIQIEEKFQYYQHRNQNHQQQLTQLLQQQKQLQFQLQQAEKTVQRSVQLLQQLQLQKQQIEMTDHRQQLEDVQQLLIQINGQVNELTKEQQHQQDHVEQTQQQQETLKQQLQSARMLHQNLQREIRQTQKLLNNLSKSDQPKSSYTLLDQLQLTQEGQHYGALLEKLLAPWLSADVVENFESCTEIARQIKILFDQPSHRLDLPHISNWIAQPLTSLWQTIWIAEDLNQAQQKLAQCSNLDSILSKDGYWCSHYWQINLNIDQQDSAYGQLQYRIHLQQLEQQFSQVAEQVVPLQQQLEQIEQQFNFQQQQLKQTLSTLKQAQQQQQKYQQEEIRLQTILTSNQEKTRQLEQQIQHLQQQMYDDQQDQVQINLDLVSLKLKLETVQPEATAMQDSFQQYQKKLQCIQQQVQQDQQTLQQFDQQCVQQQNKQALLTQDIAFKQQRIEDLSEQILQQRQQLQGLSARLQSATSQEQQAGNQAEIAHQAWQEWQQQLEQLQQTHQHLNQQRVDKQQIENQLRDQLENVRLDWQKHKAEQHHVMAQLQEIGQPQPIREEINTQQIKQQLEKTEQQCQKIGAINLAAYEELQQLQHRYDELDHQIQDLTQTVEQLHAAIQDIDQETRQIFMHTFEKINQELQVLFPKVFTGGEASLSLEDGWQSGVKLMARPPGKRNSTLALLSGGEKALTALSLVFAIFRLNPAPFCVLDEVDAPLDDANVNRFCNLVKELSQQVQFIYITHNKLAMTMATDLLGVTMPDAGSSKLVAVSLAQAESYVMTTE